MRWLCLLILLASCGGGSPETPVAAPVSNPQMAFSILAVLPHDSTSFTEGLELHDSTLYESAGNYGESALDAYNVRSGRLVKRIPLAADQFGEGITVLGDRLYQLTYKEHNVFVYHYPDLKLLKTGYWAHQGWGMTNDGTYLITDDSTDKLYFIDPGTLKETKALSVTDVSGPVFELNELEYVDGRIYANRWHTNLIYRIDPQSGRVTGMADLGDLFAQMGLSFHPGDGEDVMNGIAYDPKTKTFIVTGKRWPRAFEVRFN
jgi:glutamine cyclotransferase